MTQAKITPRNLTARLAHVAVGNPASSSISDAVANCYPGLEMDVRNLDRRFFPGLVFEFVARDDTSAPYSQPLRYGARLSYVDVDLDPDLQLDTPAAQKLNAALNGDAGSLLSSGGEWYIDWIVQSGKKISMSSVAADGSEFFYDGLWVWRLVRGLEPGPVTLHLRRRDRNQSVTLEGWRRMFTDPETGALSAAYQPGEMAQSLCSPWQHDFRDCACHYWASNHPDVVYGENLPGEATLPDGQSIDPVRANTLLDWLRADRSRGAEAAAEDTIPKNRPYQVDHFQINHTWQQLAIVLENREIPGIFDPKAVTKANPFASPDELAKELRETLAPLEMALALEYMYARWSLLSPQEAADTRFPTMKAHVTFVRHYLMLISASEMQHIRWANQLLWELWDAKLIPSYEPVLTPAKYIPNGKKGARPAELRRLDNETLDSFISAEAPSGAIDGAYSRVVATLKQSEYPAHMAELAIRIDTDGTTHYSRFRDIKNVLRAYKDATPQYPYLRKINIGTRKETQEVLALYEGLRANLAIAYRDDAQNAFDKSAKFVLAARLAMITLDSKADDLASQGTGVPFFDTEET
ncbi:MAG TPA: ferritin-like domain-containing protein [Polyangium sp.]|nr:ferritin-like domain-containing protein [Polyangium sp.]